MITLPSYRYSDHEHLQEIHRPPAQTHGPLVILALILGIARVLVDLRLVFGSPTIAQGFDRMITNILSLFIVIELLKSCWSISTTTASS